MSLVPDNLKYAKSHEWVLVDNGVATIGISDHAQEELTDIVFVELPEVGRKLESGEQCAVVESVKTASDIYAPITGEIVEVNESLNEDPALVNSSPYHNGWFIKINISDSSDLDSLLSASDYQSQIGES